MHLSAENVFYCKDNKKAFKYDVFVELMKGDNVQREMRPQEIFDISKRFLGIKFFGSRRLFHKTVRATAQFRR